MRLGACETCPYRKSNPDVLMVQTSEVWDGHDTANGLHSTRRCASLFSDRCVRASLKYFWYDPNGWRRCRSPKTTTSSRQSGRIEPISLSACPFCHGDRGAIDR